MIADATLELGDDASPALRARLPALARSELALAVLATVAWSVPISGP